LQIIIKIYITSHIKDGCLCEGPIIHAYSYESAELIAKNNGLNLEGELQDILQDILDDVLTEDLDNRVLH
tara:strand:- start:473 stop:682 length:210 start_codon:yes stop_codon:yes gene_type:complete